MLDHLVRIHSNQRRECLDKRFSLTNSCSGTVGSCSSFPGNVPDDETLTPMDNSRFDTCIEEDNTAFLACEDIYLSCNHVFDTCIDTCNDLYGDMSEDELGDLLEACLDTCYPYTCSYQVCDDAFDVRLDECYADYPFQCFLGDYKACYNALGDVCVA